MARTGFYIIFASIASSLLLVMIFYFLALAKNSYSPVDIYGGMIYVFILSMIVSASIWPGIIKKGGEKFGGD